MRARGLLVGLLILGGCSQGWTTSSRSSFVDDCSESGKVYPSECACIQRELEERGYTPSDVKNLDSDSDEKLNDEIFDIMFQCAGQ